MARKDFNPSPLPWYIDGKGDKAVIRAANHVIVAVRHRLPANVHYANLRLIVAALNALAEIRAILKKAGGSNG